MTSDTTPAEHPTTDDLAAFALDAMDGDEARAVEAHLATDAEAAGTERSLRSAAGELGASGIVIVETTPPPALRTRVLGAARDRRPAAASVEGSPVEMHRTELSRAVLLLRGLAPDAWNRTLDPPELAGWTVHDAVAHLAANESLLAQVLGVHLPSVPEVETLNEPRTGLARARHRTLPPTAALDELEAAAEAVDAHVSSLDGDGLQATVEMWGQPTTIVGSLYTRSFETWTHADDVRRATGVPELAPPARSMHLLCRAAVELVPRMLRARGVEPPERLVRFHLSGPGEASWELALPGGAVQPAGPGAPDAEVLLDTVALCRAVSARIPVGGLPYTSRGDDELARQIIDAVPALAVV